MEKYPGFPIFRPIRVYRGTAYEIYPRIICLNAETNKPYLLDTSTYTGAMQVRATVDSDVVIAEATVLTGIGGVAPHQHNLVVSLPAEITRDFPHGAVWRYDLKLFDPSGRPMPLFYGTFHVQGDVTK